MCRRRSLAALKKKVSFKLFDDEMFNQGILRIIAPTLFHKKGSGYDDSFVISPQMDHDHSRMSDASHTTVEDGTGEIEKN